MEFTTDGADADDMSPLPKGHIPAAAKKAASSSSSEFEPNDQTSTAAIRKATKDLQPDEG